MLEVTHFETYGWEAAIRGMRNPLNSWAKSDSQFNIVSDDPHDSCATFFEIGPNDLNLMKRLRASGSDDRKFMRQIMVSCDINAPLYWWKEFDTYKVATVANSCSTMHTIHKTPFTKDMFSIEDLLEPGQEIMGRYIEYLNALRDQYTKEEDPAVKKVIWRNMIQMLPSSFNQKRTWTGNYEVLCNMYRARHLHKLTEWHTFCDAILKLPYAKELILEARDDVS